MFALNLWGVRILLPTFLDKIREILNGKYPDDIRQACIVVLQSWVALPHASPETPLPVLQPIKFKSMDSHRISEPWEIEGRPRLCQPPPPLVLTFSGLSTPILDHLLLILTGTVEGEAKLESVWTLLVFMLEELIHSASEESVAGPWGMTTRTRGTAGHIVCRCVQALMTCNSLFVAA